MAPRTRETDPEEYDPSTEREISLGTPTILGIFFALALVCACFFGFGYTLGRKSTQNASPDPTSSPTATLFNAPKPTAGSPVAPPAPKTPAVEPQIVTQTLPADPTPSHSSNSPIAPSDRIIAGDKLPTATTPAPPQPGASSSQPSTGSFVVQVAAVSSQEVADILLASLQKKGYSVAVHQEPQDKLLHVQIGPFPTRPAAEAMRQRVIADGFNAIVK